MKIQTYKANNTCISPLCIKLILLLVMLSLMGACEANVEAEVDDQKLAELQQQLREVYKECSNEGIQSPEELADVLNNGGNGLSKQCRTAMANVDFEGVVTKFNITLEFETPKPAEEVNPFRASDAWIMLTEWNATTNQLIVTSGIQTLNWDNVTIEGVNAEGAASLISGFSIVDLTASDLSIAYTIDYSGSMLEADITKVSEYFADFHGVLPAGIPASVQIFSDAVTVKTTGFQSDAETVTGALAFDQSYDRASTALFDAWGSALEKLASRNSILQLNIVATDGFENSSTSYDQAGLKALINQKVTFNLIIAAGWSEPDLLKNIVGENGMVVFKYQIDEALDIAEDISNTLAHIKLVTINENIDSYTKLRFSLNSVNKLIVSLSGS